MDLVDKVLPIFEAHKGEGDIEVEIRFGKHNGSLFDTNVGKDTWKRVLNGLKKFDGWEETKSSTSEVYYSDANNVRITCDEATGEQIMIQKISVTKDDFKRDPLDVRFCVAREIPTRGSTKWIASVPKLVTRSYVRTSVST